MVMAMAVAAALVLTGCQMAGAVAWTGDCPPGQGSDTYYLVAIEQSASERSPALLHDRLGRIERRADQAADCEATFEVVVLDSGRARSIYRNPFSSPLNTEQARDRQVPAMAAKAMSEIQSQLSAMLSQPPSATSDPGVVYRLLADRLAQLGPKARIVALVLSDGVTDTPQLDLNRSLPVDEHASLAERLAPPVDLEGRVGIEWPDIGRTADSTGPPGDWVEALLALWTTVCQTRHAAPPCLVTSA